MRFVVALAALSFAYASFESDSWLDSITTKLPTTPVEAGNEILARIQQKVDDYKLNHPDGVASEYPYFNFLPQFQASMIPDGAAVSDIVQYVFLDDSID